jgi:tetratricopeptide (TPR) repeat protein
MNQNRKPRGVRASEEGLQKLRQAKANQRDEKGKPMTYERIACKSRGIDPKTVQRFFGGKSPVDTDSAMTIIQALGLKWEEVIGLDEWNTQQQNPNPSAIDDIALSLSIRNDFLLEGVWQWDSDKILTYEIRSQAQNLLILPHLDYLLKFENGNPIKGFSKDAFESYFKWQLPNIDLRLVNNSNKTIYINNVIFEVEKSYLDSCPVLILDESASEDTGGLALRKISLVNEGWGEVKDVSIRFNLVPIDQVLDFDSCYQHEIELGDFVDKIIIDFSNALSKTGVKVGNLPSSPMRCPIMQYIIYGFLPLDTKLQLLESCILNGFSPLDMKLQLLEGLKTSEEGMAAYEHDIDIIESIFEYQHSIERTVTLHANALEIIESLGDFRNSTEEGRYVAIAYGEISFTELTIEGEAKESTIQFSTKVPLVNIFTGGAPGPPTYQYGVKLDVTRENYEATVYGGGSSVSQFLKSGETDRFNILVGVEKSSFHTFRIKLMYNDTQSLLSPTIKLRAFVPKSQSENIKSFDALLIEEGERLARDNGCFDAAALKFQEALKLNPSLSFDPVKKAQTEAAPYLFREASDLIKKGQIEEGVSVFNIAHKFDPTTQFSDFVSKYEILDIERLDERVKIANSLFTTTMSVHEFGTEWHPKNKPPTFLESLVWFWVIHPNLGAVAADLPEELKQAIEHYYLGG